MTEFGHLRKYISETGTYQRIVKVMVETERLMRVIDKIK